MGNITDGADVPTLRDYAIYPTADAIAEFTESNVTQSMDQFYEKVALDSRPQAPLDSATVPATDDGPPSAFKIARDKAERLRAANDNKKAGRCHLKTMYASGELGNGQPESELHWNDLERSRLDLITASGEPINDIGWRETMLPFFEAFNGDHLTSTSPDEGLSFNDDGEFDDIDTIPDGNAVDSEGWNVYRDMAPHLAQLYAKQITSLEHDVMGQDFELLRDAIESNLTVRTIGVKEGFKDRASASACGKGMLRAALRNLSRFYVRLDRLEERGDRPRDVWTFVRRSRRIYD